MPWVTLVAAGAMTLFCLACTPSSKSAGLTGEAAAGADPAALTYRSAWLESGEVTLAQGMFRQPAAPGSAAELTVRLGDWRAYGRVNGRQTGAVVLVTQAGGTGTFYDLALLTAKGGGWVNSDVVPLGDRVDVHALEIRDDWVVVTLTAHGPEDPACCPTRRVERSFTVQGGKLDPAGEAPSPPAPAAIVGPTWQWLETLYGDDSRSEPARPEAYTVTFAADGRFSIHADCNQQGGTYRLEEKSIAIEVTRSTQLTCPEGSLGERFVRDLAAGTTWFLQDGDLYIDLKYDTGTMRLAAQR